MLYPGERVVYVRALPRVATYLVALALASGFVDATSYLGLGKVFTANMTGNTVLLGVAVAQGSGVDAARAGAALAGFCIGVAVGVALMGRSNRPWPQPAAGTFLLEIVALVALLAGWTAVGVASFRYGLIALSGVAMGAQSAAVRAARTGGVATTYVTGTLTNTIARLMERALGRSGSAEGSGLGGGVWVTYAVGALGGAALVKAWHGAVIAVPLAIVCGVAAASLWRGGKDAG
jgi:uncharacterized membrane protein YoaK (UPF0700 family)